MPIPSNPRRARPWERIVAWQRAHRLFLEVHQATVKWPVQERYALGAQARRSAFSVPANIVEGNAKRGKGELRKYLDISLGSLAELQYTLHAAADLKILSETDWTRLDDLADEAGRCLWGLYKAAPNARAEGG